MTVSTVNRSGISSCFLASDEDKGVRLAIQCRASILGLVYVPDNFCSQREEEGVGELSHPFCFLDPAPMIREGSVLLTS